MYLVEIQYRPGQRYKHDNVKCKTLKWAKVLAKGTPGHRVRIVKVVKGKRVKVTPWG
jgi:hypothetical protein